MLAAGALVASLFAVGAAPAVAQPNSTANPNHNPDAGADWSACVGAAGSYDAMFPDVSEGHAHGAAINCIAYYGITVGKGDGSYAPDEHVSAFQMGHFVRRAADLMGADGDAVLAGVTLSDTVTRLEMAQLMFGLVNDIDDDVRINTRTGQIEFYDDEKNVWNVVDDFFADAKAQVPIFESQLIGAIYEMGITRGTRGDGTLVSTAGSTFGPFSPVTRAQMATFITKTLDHSNLRPEGLAVQENGLNSTQVSYRDADFAPIDDARIDVFSALYPDDAFDDDDGECEIRFVKDETPSHSTCEIDIGDQLTDDDGNVEFTLDSKGDAISLRCGTSTLTFSTVATSAGRTFWAWTGNLGDEVDEDTTLVELESVARPVGAAGPDYARISGGLPTNNELAKMGETVTFKLQLYSDVGPRDEADYVDDAAVGPDRSRNPYHLRIQKYYVVRVAGSDSDATEKNGSASMGHFSKAPGNWDYLAVPGVAAGTAFQTEVDTVVWPNSDGEYAIRLTNPDLNARAPASYDDLDVGVMFTLTPFTTGNDLITGNLLDSIEADRGANYATDVPTGATSTRAIGHVIFSDDPSDPHKVSGGSASYQIISGSRTGNSVTVTVIDQYGDPMRNVSISVSSDLDDVSPDSDEVVYPEEVDITLQTNEDGDGDGTPGEDTDEVSGSFKTRSNGEYRIGYSYIGDSAQTEKITPSSLAILGDNPETPDMIETDHPPAEGAPGSAETGAEVPVYWAKLGINGQSDTNTDNNAPEPVLLWVSDVGRRTIVANEGLPSGDNPRAYFYDEDDTYIINNIGATFEMFEEALMFIAKGNCPGTTVMWENYTLTDTRNPGARPGSVDRTIWELTLPSGG